MPSSSPEVRWDRRLSFRGAAALALLCVLTGGVGAWWQKHLEATMPAHQQAVVTEALAFAEARFAGLQSEMVAQAQILAGASDIAQGLRQYSQGETEAATERLVAYFAGLSLPEQMAVELYDPKPQLVVWQGFSMPLDPSPNAERFLESPQTAVVNEDGKREATVLWWPIREGNRLLGALRIVRLVTFRAPVRNQYLRDYDLADEWARSLGLPVRVQFEQDALAHTTAPEQTRLLEGADGTLLGRVYVQPPSAEALLQQSEQRFQDVLRGWVTLLLFWTVALLWHTYRTAPQPGTPGEVPWWKTPTARFALWASAWWGVRYALIALEVPVRWQSGKAPLAPLFDPQHLASPAGGGLLHSTGDLLITAVFTLIFVVGFCHLFVRLHPSQPGLPPLLKPHRLEALRTLSIVAVAVLALCGLTTVLAAVTRHAVLDSTLDYFVHTGLLPERLVLIVFCSLLLMTLALLLLATVVARKALLLLRRQPPGALARRITLAGLAGLVTLASLYGLVGLDVLPPWYAVVMLLVVSFASALRWYSLASPGTLILRSILPVIFLLALLLYPLLYSGLDTQRRLRMVDAVATFEEVDDPRVVYGLTQLLVHTRDDAQVRRILGAMAQARASAAALDTLAQAHLRGSLLASLGAYDVSLTFFDTSGTPVARYYETDQSPNSSVLDQIEKEEFGLLRTMYAEDPSTGVLVEQVTGRRETDRFQYEGLTPVYTTSLPDPVGWAMARAEPRMQPYEENAPFPRVLLPASYYSNLYSDLSIAEFRRGVLVRSIGRNFGRYRLDEHVLRTLRTEPELWRQEKVREHDYLTYYRRDPRAYGATDAIARDLGTDPAVVAVRISAVNTFDHLYYLLRLTVSGLFIGLPIYLIGLYLRRRAGLLPARQKQFRGKVLNAFFAVGIITAAAMGFAGLQVVTGENERAIQSWLRQHLERVEETLALDARSSELPYRVLERTNIDSLASRMGLDLNVYRGEQLMSSSRYELIRDHLIDKRLPIQAYQTLFFEGFRFTSTEQHVGSFTYTAGYYALPDEQGRPYFVLSVPTLPEQERLEEERARTVAYLFGSLLGLVLMVMLTASLLAARLTQPIARLRGGLEDVAQGRFARIPPVRSRDEIGELVQTFNTMQEQLADSRRRLAQQERQLAWREMARQVAHEIKNPLTPMKLSVQHLRRAYDKLAGQSPAPADAERQRFDSLFGRITTTLIEQIDTLARIANEFSTFARMPRQILEELDLNAVVSEAVALMQEESDTTVVVELEEEPLVLRADREELRRIYINLIKNAFQAMPAPGGGQVRVATLRHPGTNGEAGWAYSTVSDTGTGIPPELRGKIFEPNFSTKTSGTGLGLAIIKQSVENLQGDIDFETEEGVGTTFRIRLPLVR